MVGPYEQKVKYMDKIAARSKKYYDANKIAVAERNKKYRDTNKEQLTKKYQEYCRSKRGRFNKILKDIRKRAGTTITIEDLEELWDKQEGNCALSGLPMVYDHIGPSLDAVSIDRIEPKSQYILSNIRLTSKWANMARNILTDQEFVDWCRLVIK